MTTLDLVIRGGTVYDGTGRDGFVADVGIVDGRIVELGTISGRGREEFDARGMIVTPGFVDIHTHFDGQAVWSDQLDPSSRHGVTTVLIGNCGVGFAPCREQDRVGLVELMEGVEDIPAPVLDEGLTWDWESFPDYLDVLERRARDVDVCALVPHAPLRVYVMGDRALRLEPANAGDIEQMRTLLAEAVDAGAFGVSSSRATGHRSSRGQLESTTLAREREILGLLSGLGDAGRGVLQIILESNDPDVLGDYQMVARAVERTGQRGVFSLIQSPEFPDLYRDILKFSDELVAGGVSFRPVVAPRPIGILFGLQGSRNPFSGTRTYHAMRDLPLAERVRRLSDPETRRRILGEERWEFNHLELMKRLSFDRMYRFGNPPNYTPEADQSVATIAAAEGRTAEEVAYDLLLESDGNALIYVPFANYASGDLSACQEMLTNPNALVGLGDGGAHVGYICDASFTTWLLAYWVKEREALSLPDAVRRLTSDTAESIGLTDRGQLEVGLKADVNVIDMNSLALQLPCFDFDLPAGGRRLKQAADGYELTVVSGVVTYRKGVDTGARPGRLVRSS